MSWAFSVNVKKFVNYAEKCSNFKILKFPTSKNALIYRGKKKKSEFLNSTRPCLSALEFLKKIKYS